MPFAICSRRIPAQFNRATAIWQFHFNRSAVFRYEKMALHHNYQGWARPSLAIPGGLPAWWARHSRQAAAIFFVQWPRALFARLRGKCLFQARQLMSQGKALRSPYFVDEKYAVEVITLMLKSARQQSFGRIFDRVAGEILCL